MCTEMQPLIELIPQFTPEVKADLVMIREQCVNKDLAAWQSSFQVLLSSGFRMAPDFGFVPKR